MADESPEDRAERLAAAINRHGHPFQYRILAELEPLHQRGWTNWHWEAVEFPVSTDDGGTRADFVLWAHQTDWWILGECKRVNPAFSDWIFLRAPYVRRAHQENFIAEVTTEVDGIPLSGGMVVSNVPWGKFYHIGIDVKTNRPGDPSGGSQRSAIEDAATQVCRSLNGMVTHLIRRRGAMGPERRRCLVPVIFTTAKLYTSEIDLSDADLVSGTIQASALNATEQPYLLYQYNQSPGITHAAARRQEHHELPAVLVSDYIRTIPIVSAAGARDFFMQFNPARFVPQEFEWTSADDMAGWSKK